MDITTRCVAACATNVDLIVKVGQEDRSIFLRTACANQARTTSSGRSDLETFSRSLAIGCLRRIDLHEVCTQAKRNTCCARDKIGILLVGHCLAARICLLYTSHCRVHAEALEGFARSNVALLPPDSFNVTSCFSGEQSNVCLLYTSASCGQPVSCGYAASCERDASFIARTSKLCRTSHYRT